MTSGAMKLDIARHIAIEVPSPDTITVPVLSVVDGDGFRTRIKACEFTGQPRDQAEFEATIRFAFIDAPEMDQPGGPEAKAYLASLIADQWVELDVLTKMETGRSIDQYGRIIAVPFLRHDYSAALFKTPTGELHKADGYGEALRVTRNVELEMVVNGWAWVLERYGPDSRYLDALEDARVHRRGIWANDDNVHPVTFKKQKFFDSTKRLPPAEIDNGQCPSDDCDGELVMRTGTYGAFFGCTNYPACKFVRNVVG